VDNFLDYIERYKFAILGTVLFHVLFFMTTNLTTIKTPYGNIADEYEEVELDADAIEMDEEMREMLDRLNEQNEWNNEQLYNLTADQNDQRERSYENFSAQELDAQVEREARELEQQFFDEWAATHPDSDSPPPRNDRTDESTDNASESRNKPNNSNVTNNGENAFAGQVMVSFNLKGRKAHALGCHPSLAVMLVKSAQMSKEHQSLACALAALIENKDPMASNTHGASLAARLHFCLQQKNHLIWQAIRQWHAKMGCSILTWPLEDSQ
jgi:hypothetical protein